jgi:hypothetical protein
VAILGDGRKELLYERSFLWLHYKRMWLLPSLQCLMLALSFILLFAHSGAASCHAVSCSLARFKEQRTKQVSWSFDQHFMRNQSFGSKVHRGLNPTKKHMCELGSRSIPAKPWDDSSLVIDQSGKTTAKPPQTSDIHTLLANICCYFKPFYFDAVWFKKINLRSKNFSESQTR